MELTKQEKELLTLYNRFYGTPFDPWDLRCIQRFQNMYCILQTVPSGVGGKVEKLGDFQDDQEGVFSNTLDTELTRLSRQVALEVKEFNDENQDSKEVSRYLPVALACANPDIELAVDQGIAPYNDYRLFAKVCLFVSKGHTTTSELREFLAEKTYDKSHAIKGNRNLYLSDYVIALLLEYGLLCENPEHDKKAFDDTVPNLSEKEKEILRVYYKFYGRYFVPNDKECVDNAVTAYCILQSTPEDIGTKLDKKYEFLMASTMSGLTSAELEMELAGLDNPDKQEAIRHYYCGNKEDMLPIVGALKHAGFYNTYKLRRLAKACAYAQNNPNATSDDVLFYLNNIDKEDGYVDDFLKLNKKIVVFMERFGMTGRNIKKEQEKNEGLVRKLARIFGGQKEKN